MIEHLQEPPEGDRYTRVKREVANWEPRPMPEDYDPRQDPPPTRRGKPPTRRGKPPIHREPPPRKEGRP